MAKNFSDKYLSSLKPTDSAYTVREAKGFTLKVWPTGAKTFLFIHEVAGKRKQHNLGAYPHVTLSEARDKYNDIVKALARNEPLPKPPETVAEPVAVMTVKELIDEYMVDSEKDDVATWANNKRGVYKNKIKNWHARPIDSISKAEAIKLVDKERLIGDGAMRNTYRTVHALFQYAEDRNYIIKNPLGGLKKIKPALKNKERSRFLAEKEIKYVWDHITNGGGTLSTRRALKLILVTAQRPGEVAGMHRREIEGDWWTIPAERAMKGNGDHRVFLTKMAKELIGDGQGFIFPSLMKDSKSGYITTTTLSQHVHLANFFGLPRWTPHDLRRSARTHMSRLRIPREHAEAVLNHAKQGMVKIYDRYEYDDEKREALQVWERELLRLTAQSSTSE